MSKIRKKIIEVTDNGMVRHIFLEVNSCRVLSTGSLSINYIMDGVEKRKVFKRSEWQSYSRVWENAYLGGYLTSHPLKNDFMNEPAEPAEPIEYEPLFEAPDICYKCRNWDMTDVREMEGICRKYNIETYAEDGCQDIELKEEK